MSSRDAPPASPQQAGGLSIPPFLRTIMNVVFYVSLFNFLRSALSGMQGGDLVKPGGGEAAGSSLMQQHSKDAAKDAAKDSAKNMMERFGLDSSLLDPYPNAPKFSGRGPKHEPVWGYGTPIDITVHISTSATPPPANATGDDDPSVLHSLVHKDFFGKSSLKTAPPEDYSEFLTLPVGAYMKANNTVHAHVRVARSSPRPGGPPGSCRSWPLTVHRVRRKRSGKKMLLGEEPDEEAEMAVAVVDDTVLGRAAADHEEDQWLMYWKPALTIQVVEMNAAFARGGIPPQMSNSMDFADLETGAYYPALYFNEFWQTTDRQVAINGTVDEVTLKVEIGSIAMWKWQGMSQMEHQWAQQAKMGGNPAESDIIKGMFTDTNPVLLAVTFIVSLLHSVFDMLAFKNDIAFFKKKKSMVGLSIRTMIVNAFFQVVIFLYLMDNDTSFMILASNGVGLAIEFWKILKAFKFSFAGGEVSWGEKEDTKAETESKEYDEIATTHLLYITGPLMVGYSTYSLMNMAHKSWYSWVLSSLVGFIYMFGFVMMTPQLFINYKLKSVAHMNMRTLTYKTLGTFVDDLFAFVIKMPIMHRLSCFRDDIIFFIFLYQRYIYRVDYKRANDPVIVSVLRTPIAPFMGSLSSAPGPALASSCISANISALSAQSPAFTAARVTDVLLGNVISAGIGQAPARQAWKGAAGAHDAARCTTVNKVCASGMKAAMYAAQSIQLGNKGAVVCGGFESMSNVPFYLPALRGGSKLGNAVAIDGVVHDGLWDCYNDQHMGMCGEKCAGDYGITREDQDAFAIESYRRASEAVAAGKFAKEIAPYTVSSRRGDTVVDTDVEPSATNPDKIPKLRSAFKKEGTVTAANASSLNDGACTMIMMDEEEAKAMGLKPVARVLGFADAEQAPEDFTTAPALAVPLALEAAGLTMGDVDFHEINEAFSVVALANMKIMDLDPAKVNVNGGAVALGHPIGCSGARIVGTLASVLEQNDGNIGVASICNGGGGASAFVIERM
ncbi:hypothetical protein TeGR_g15211 [Tetraparma gracilis]|uniref:Acetyl-CoA C-acetyltransferase n=1 Tax=Tetraparma gracilis TaxID=2962635 RepID=A0ABQ6MZK6_9STRA|nr:hypothetical protein TeGR_g15211 [Tetraparma gracilis]